VDIVVKLLNDAAKINQINKRPPKILKFVMKKEGYFINNPQKSMGLTQKSILLNG